MSIKLSTLKLFQGGGGKSGTKITIRCFGEPFSTIMQTCSGDVLQSEINETFSGL